MYRTPRRCPPLAAGRVVPRLALLTVVLLPAAVAGADPTFVFIDLQPQANHRLAADLHDNEGNNLGKVPRGEQKLEGTTFRIGEKFVHLRGEHAPDAPEKVEGIKVDALFDRLHILHSTGYGEAENRLDDGTVIGEYVVHYADNSTARIPVVYGEDLRDWWVNPDRSSLKRAKAAWTGSNPASEANMAQIRLYSVAWENPNPNKKVTSIDFVSKKTACDPFLIALTIEKK